MIPGSNPGIFILNYIYFKNIKINQSRVGIRVIQVTCRIFNNLTRVNPGRFWSCFMARFEVTLPDALLEKFTQLCEDGGRSEKTRELIENWMLGRERFDEEGMEILKFIKKLQPDLLLKQHADAELMSQTMYEELKRQNEYLKLILRRSTIASALSYNILSEVGSEELAKERFQFAIDSVTEDYKSLEGQNHE